MVIRALVAAAAATLGMSLVACSSTPTAPAASPGPATAEKAVFPVTVQNCGRSLTFQRPPSRVITGYQPVFENLVALGLGDQIIGRLNFSENGPEGFLPGQKAVYDKIPEISPTIAFPNKEAMLAQRPDFVISESFSQFNASKGVATIQQLTDVSAPVFITGNWCDVESKRNATINDIFADLRNLGAIFGVPERAAALQNQLQSILDDIHRRVGNLPPVRVLATDGGDGPVYAYGGTGLMNQMITLAGGVNVLADVADDYAEVSAERVAASRPDALLVLDYATLFGKAQPSAQAKADQAFKIAASSPAAQQRRFLGVPAAAAHSGYRNILEIREIARFLHPDAFS